MVNIMITLHFDKLFNNDRLLEPCFVSLPFAKGTLTDASSISLLQNNQALPIQTKITSTYEDGSIRYLFVRFMADLPANRATDITCVLQPESVKHTLPLSYTETVDGFTVSNGELTFEVENHSLHLFRTLDAFGKHYDKECFIGPYLTNSRQISFQMSFDHWTIEEAGDICIVLSCKGQLLCENTSSLPCEVRLTVYAGKSWIDTSVRLINATKNTLEISSYGFSIQEKEKDSVRSCVASSNYKTDFLTSDSGETVEKEITAQMLMNQGNEHFAEVFYGTFFADCTTRQGGVCGTIYQAFQNYPKAVRASSSGIELFLVPEGDTPVIMQSGMAREQRFQLYFHPAEEPLSEINNRSTIYQMPDRPVLPSKIYEAAGVMPDIFVHEKDFDTECALIQCGDSHARSYGMMNWGDTPDMNYTAQGRGNGHLIWTNNEYDFPHACMLMFAKSGIRRFLDYCLVTANHQIDVDVCHYSEDLLLLGGQWEHTQGHTVGGKIVCSHQWVEGILDCYHATGDERYYETAIGIGDNILRLLDTPTYQKEGSFSARETGWALRSLTALYTETHDTKWLTKSDLIVNQFKDWANAYGGWLAPYMDNTVIRVPFMISVAVGSLMHYYREFPRKDIRTMILNAVDDMIENCLMDNGLFYYKELPSLNRLGNNPLILEALAIAYELSGNKKYLQAGFKTYAKTIENMAHSGGGTKHTLEDTVLTGSTGTKQFAQGFLPVATYYKALEKARL